MKTVFQAQQHRAEGMCLTLTKIVQMVFVWEYNCFWRLHEALQLLRDKNLVFSSEQSTAIVTTTSEHLLLDLHFLFVKLFST